MIQKDPILRSDAIWNMAKINQAKVYGEYEYTDVSRSIIQANLDEHEKLSCAL